MTRTKDRTYLRNRRRLQRTTDICALCGEWIDPDLKFPHPKSFSADHITPVGKGGNNRGKLQAAHLDCNRRKKDRLPAATHSRAW